MRVREAMTPWPYTVSAEDSLAAAVDLMARKGIHQVPVMLGNRIVGILTDGDVRVALGPDSRRTPLAELDAAAGGEIQVEAFMTPSVASVSPSDHLSAAAAILAEGRVGALPVIDEDDDVIGIISVTDVLRMSVLAFEAAEAE
jgi:acetoin utilization protein AcuB